MFLRKISLAALSAHLVLGNLCMMPMAMAQEMPDMPEMNHDMSGMASNEDQGSSKGMPCDGQHCFTHALPSQTSLATEGMLVVTVPTTPITLEYALENETPVPVSNAPPGQFIHIQTIVLRN